MSSGKEHDKAITAWVIPFSFCIGMALGIEKSWIGGLAFYIGGLWLSPDLDTNSLSTKRWGLLQILWRPYRKIVPHRSLISHGVCIGTLIRLIYLFTLISLLLTLMTPIGMPSAIDMQKAISQFIIKFPKETLALLIGLEGSAWLHIMQDGDPWPMKWPKK